jgi:hypothetical protein
MGTTAFFSSSCCNRSETSGNILNESKKNNNNDDIKENENENDYSDKEQKPDLNTCDKDEIEQNIDKNQINQINEKNENNKENEQNEENKIIEEEQNKENNNDLKNIEEKKENEEKENEEEKENKEEKKNDLIENKDSIEEKKDIEQEQEQDNKLSQSSIPSKEQKISENQNIIEQNNDYENKENNTPKSFYEIHANQISIITELNEERKNPLSIFESKTDEEDNNLSQKDINENNDIDKDDKDNGSEKIRVNKELFAKIRKPNLHKKGDKKIVKGEGVSFTLDKTKNKKVKRYFTSDFLSLNRRNKTPDKKVIEDLEKIKNKMRQKKEKQLKEKKLKKNRALHKKIMSDILSDKSKIKEEKDKEELKEENAESNSESEDDEEQRRKMMKYGSIFDDLLKVNFKINQIIQKKKEKLENMNKSDGENDPYSYLHNSYGFPRTNTSFMPDSYLKNLGNKKVNKVKTSKAKIVNFYETVRAATSEYNFKKYRNSLIKNVKNRLNEDKDKEKDKKPKYKRKNCSSIDLDSYARKNKKYLADKGYNKTVYSSNTHKSKKSNYPKELYNLKKTPNFQLKTCKKIDRLSTAQNLLNKRKVFDESYNKTNPKKSQSKFFTKKENKPKIDRYDDIDNSEHRIVDDDNDQDNIQMSDLEKIKRNFKNKLISITNDLSDMKENEESSILLYYRGPVDIKNISLLNYKETILYMKNQMSELGFEISKIKENIFKCSKDDENLIIQIVKIQSEMLYYLITKEKNV